MFFKNYNTGLRVFFFSFLILSSQFVYANNSEKLLHDYISDISIWDFNNESKRNIVLSLIEDGTDVNYYMNSINDDHALCFAAYANDENLFEMILSSDTFRYMPKCDFGKYGSLIGQYTDQPYFNKPFVIDEIVNHKDKIDFRDTLGYLYLRSYLKSDFYYGIQQLIKSSISDPNEVPYSDVGPLLLFTQSYEVTSLMLSLGASHEVKFKGLSIIEHYAAENKLRQTKAIIDYDPDIVSKDAAANAVSIAYKNNNIDVVIYLCSKEVSSQFCQP